MPGKTKLKVGLLVDSDIASTYIYELAVWGQQQRHLSISHLIISKTQRTHRGRRAGTFDSLERIRLRRFLTSSSFDLLTKIERVRLRRWPGHKAHSQQHDLKIVVSQWICVEPQIYADGYRYSSEDIRIIKSLDLDVIVMCGCGALRGEILNSARLGIISIKYGDNRMIHGDPPGFWEVYFRQDATGFTIERLTEELRSGEVLVGGRFPTKHFYLLNQASLYKRSAYHLLRLLDKTATTRALPSAKETYPYFNKPYATPNLANQFAYGYMQAASITRDTARRLLRKHERWGLAFARSDWTTLDFSRANRIKNAPYHFLADPFVVTQEGRDFCFVEDYDYKIGKGCIAVYELKDKTAERLGEAIVEPFHLSFPYIFRFAGKLYICPETSENGDIRLYECVSFPLQWKLFKILMREVDAVDTMIFENGGLWWLFTNIDPLKMNDFGSELMGFYADSPLTGDWIPHRKNPIVIDSSKGRNGGLLFHQGSTYRVAQRQAFARYGRSISINKIEILNKEDYFECESCSVEPNFFPNIEGVHHLHSNNRVSVFDCLELTTIG